MNYARAVDPANQTFLEQAEAPVTPLPSGHVALDLDLFAQDNSHTRKEGVGYTYRGSDGYGVMPGVGTSRRGGKFAVSRPCQL